MTHAMPFPVVNAMGAIGNPNIALEAAKTGRMEHIGSGPVARIDARALSDARRSGLSAVNVTLGHVVGSREPYALTCDEIRIWDEFIAKQADHLLKVLKVEDVLGAHASGRVGVVYGFQNTEMLGQKPERVAEFSAAGVRIMQLTYNGRNAVADGCMVPDDAGLSPLGRDMVAQMNAQRVLVDLSHGSKKTCLDAIRHSTVPVAITHSGCRSLADLPRNKSDAELRLLAQRGGVLGIYAMPFLREHGQPLADDLLRHIEHAIDICGEDHVGFGSDGSVTAIDDMNTYMRYLVEDVTERKRAGVGASGESGAVALFLPDLCGPSQFQGLADYLERRGHGSARIEKILGGNFLRLMREIWG